MAQCPRLRVAGTVIGGTPGGEARLQVREVILKMSMSLDGFVSGPAGEQDWMFTGDDAAIQWSARSIARAGVHVMGRRTFEGMASYWPTASGPFAAPMNDIPKVYFSRHAAPAPGTLDDAEAPDSSEKTGAAGDSWQTARVATGDLRDEIARLAAEPGGEILVHGGAEFAGSLITAGLVDEYRLLVPPVALGQGRALFAGVDSRVALTLVDVIPFPSGTVAHIYRRR